MTLLSHKDLLISLRYVWMLHKGEGCRFRTAFYDSVYVYGNSGWEPRPVAFNRRKLGWEEAASGRSRHLLDSALRDTAAVFVFHLCIQVCFIRSHLVAHRHLIVNISTIIAICSQYSFHCDDVVNICSWHMYKLFRPPLHWLCMAVGWLLQGCMCYHRASHICWKWALFCRLSWKCSHM